MKKFLSIMLSAVLIVSLSACTKGKDQGTSSQSGSASQTTDNSQGGFKPNRNSQGGFKPDNTSTVKGDPINESILCDYWGVQNIIDSAGSSIKGETEETYHFISGGKGEYTFEKKLSSGKWKEEKSDFSWKISDDKVVVSLADGREYTGLYSKSDSAIKLDIGNGSTALLMQVQPPLTVPTEESNPTPTPYVAKHPEWTPQNLDGFWETLVDKYYQDYGKAYPSQGEKISVSCEYYENKWQIHIDYEDGYEGGYTYYAKPMTYVQGAMYSGCPNSDWYMQANYKEYNTLVLITYYNSSIEVAIGRIPDGQSARYWTYYSVTR